MNSDNRFLISRFSGRLREAWRHPHKIPRKAVAILRHSLVVTQEFLAVPLNKIITLREALVEQLYLLLAKIQKVTKWRFIHVTNPGRIGHLALEVDWFLKKRALGDFSGIRPVLFLQDYVPAPNEALVAAWARHMLVISNPSLKKLVYPLTQFRMLTLETNAAVLVAPADYPRI